MSDNEERHADEFDGVSAEVVAAYQEARRAYRAAKIDLKHKKSSSRRKQEDLEHEDMALQQQRDHILADLRQQTSMAEQALEEERRKQRTVEQEISTLRGRIAHHVQEHAQWEKDHRVQAQREAEEALAELRRLRRVCPGPAAQYAAQRENERRRIAMTDPEREE